MYLNISFVFAGGWCSPKGSLLALPRDGLGCLITNRIDSSLTSHSTNSPQTNFCARRPQAFQDVSIKRTARAVTPSLTQAGDVPACARRCHITTPSVSMNGFLHEEFLTARECTRRWHAAVRCENTHRQLSLINTPNILPNILPT